MFFFGVMFNHYESCLLPYSWKKNEMEYSSWIIKSIIVVFLLRRRHISSLSTKQGCQQCVQRSQLLQMAEPEDEASTVCTISPGKIRWCKRLWVNKTRYARLLIMAEIERVGTLSWLEHERCQEGLHRPSWRYFWP